MSSVAWLAARSSTALASLAACFPAVGIALNLRAILKKETWPFLIIGFLLVAYFKISIVGVALFGVAAAMIYMLMNNKKEGAATNGAQE